MTNRTSFTLPALLLTLLAVLPAVRHATAADSPPASDDAVLVLSFFRDNGQAGIFAASSPDGIHFTPLNADRPVMKPASWPGQALTRDPSMVYRDGRFHAVWTSNWAGNVFGYAESPDLKQWSEPVKVQPFPESLPVADQPRNVWAPEICWDPFQKNYAIFWSTTTKNTKGHRIFVTRTTDGKTFTPAQRFFDQKFSSIDGMMAFDAQGAADPNAGRWVLVLKNEEEIKNGGKNLRLTFAPADFSKPWEPVSGPIAGPGSTIRPKEMAEGPSLLRWQGQWFLYWDAFANGHYSLATSPDLKTWTDRTAELTMPAHPRHGTVFVAPKAAIAPATTGATP